MWGRTSSSRDGSDAHAGDTDTYGRVDDRPALLFPVVALVAIRCLKRRLGDVVYRLLRICSGLEGNEEGAAGKEGIDV